FTWPAEIQLRRVGSRLRARRLVQGQSAAGEAPQPEGGGSTKPARGGGILSGAVLVLAPAGSAEERFSWNRRERQRPFREREEPRRVDSECGEHGRLHRLPSTGQQG